ncbi:MAG TPA: S8 family serine peptidase [bacterium]|nr:S8 family serine peptidase [bacterium]
MFSEFPAFCGGTPLYVEGRVIVEFSGEVTSLKNAAGFAEKNGMKINRELPVFSYLRKKLHVVLSSDFSTEEMISVLKKNPSVKHVQPVYIRYPLEVVPDDPLYAQQWAFPVISASSAWENFTGNGSAVVAVVDSGIDYSHPDIERNMWRNKAEGEGLPGVDDDGNGYIDDIYGYNFALNSSDPMDTHSHGSHVAGIIGAATDNGTGVAGVNWSAGLMALNAINDGFFSDSALVEAISYAVMMRRDFGIRIVAVNASWGGVGGYDGDLLYQAIEEAAYAGIAFVAAAGNNGRNNDVTPLYPASYSLPNIISVAASDEKDCLWSSSNYGAGSVDLAAPGVNILSTVPFVSQARLSVSGADYAASAINFSGNTGEDGVTGQVFDCGLGYMADFPAQVSGNIALIQRGELYFWEKVTNARDAGALAVAIYNNIPDGEPGGGIIDATLGSAGDWIPAVFISNSDGIVLKQSTPVPEATVYNILLGASYGSKSGTSMAAPFVSGTIALLCSAFPEDTVSRNTWRILESTSPMLREDDMNRLITGGRLDIGGAFNRTFRLPGDINGDYGTDITDVILCLRMALELDEKYLPDGDINGDWLIDISDVIFLMRRSIGLD